MLKYQKTTQTPSIFQRYLLASQSLALLAAQSELLHVGTIIDTCQGTPI